MDWGKFQKSQNVEDRSAWEALLRQMGWDAQPQLAPPTPPSGDAAHGELAKEAGAQDLALLEQAMALAAWLEQFDDSGKR